ncbi:MAG TPA: hypothetical protein VHX66_10050 [Solirubrobacteraceae bacterium]|nr:hypothetical protein [Solirubrobacteraceae bacterium]
MLHVSHLAGLYSSLGVLYGCDGSRRTRLGVLRTTPLAPATRIARYALAGRFAAIDLTQMGVDNLDATVAVYDLRSGRRVASAPGTTPENRAESFISVSALAVNSQGVLAWIGRRSAVGVLEPTYELHVLRAGMNTTLATNTAKLAGLRLSATAVSWTDAGGRRHSARI